MLGRVYADLGDDANARKNMLDALRAIERMEASNRALGSQLTRLRELLYKCSPKGSGGNETS